MGDINLSDMKATYYPPSIQPGFMGAHVPIKHGYSSLYGSGNISYFQNFRNENISRMQMPSDEWGIMKTPYTPRPDIAVLGSTRANRHLKLPDNNISMGDPQRQREVDDFYIACQFHRDQYMDHSHRLHPLDYFKKAEYLYQCPPNPTSNYLKHPECYVKYKQPYVFPLTLERTLRIPSLPDRALTGTYNVSSDNCYKR
ncbi:hypothetical protein WA026_011726 [Henosepilachna vigintioctopunctata]|uniref:Ciliary microtubule inner protein 2C n=1 Tax=Henosepilachna vigintioctopunctata TaxID=420089 RepID=A0AAW1UA15_9CUCU